MRWRWVGVGVFLATMMFLALWLAGCAQPGGLVGPSTQEQKDRFDRENPDLAPERK